MKLTFDSFIERKASNVQEYNVLDNIYLYLYIKEM